MRECLIHPEIRKLWELEVLAPFLTPSRIYRPWRNGAGGSQFGCTCVCPMRDIVSLNRRFVYVEGWLLVDAYVGQCVRCRRIYWA
jgi:hypothetical protein